MSLFVMSRPPITDVTRLGTVLGIWAHPDDEAFLSAGLMAAARDAGQRVVCVTATLGEHGTDDPGSWPPTAWRGSASASCSASLAALGVTEHHLLGLTDGTCAAAPARADRGAPRPRHRRGGSRTRSSRSARTA